MEHISNARDLDDFISCREREHLLGLEPGAKIRVRLGAEIRVATFVRCIHHPKGLYFEATVGKRSHGFPATLLFLPQEH